MNIISIVRTIADLRSKTASWRRKGLSIALVPTMGALHAGHLALVQEGIKQANRVIVSIFVNPIQFGRGEDFNIYPRQEHEDCAQLEKVGTPLVFAPSVSEVYPEGFTTKVTVTSMSEKLCGIFRPTHFSGVTTLITKLLIQSLPDIALFGEKDYQQLQIIRRLVTDLDIPVRIIGVPTVREADGLALSSRNAYLSPEERLKATILYQMLQKVATMVEQGADPNIIIEAARRRLLTEGFSSVDYLEIRDAETLTPLTTPAICSARVLVAAWLGQTRLIDNILVNLPKS